MRRKEGQGEGNGREGTTHADDLPHRMNRKEKGRTWEGKGGGGGERKDTEKGQKERRGREGGGEKCREGREKGEGNGREGMTHADDLPHEPKHQMSLAGRQVFRADVDCRTPNGTRRRHRQQQVLMLSVHAQVRFVDGALIYRVGHRVVYQLAAQKEVSKCC